LHNDDNETKYQNLIQANKAALLTLLSKKKKVKKTKLHDDDDYEKCQNRKAYNKCEIMHKP
jgi:hypothetical protein